MAVLSDSRSNIRPLEAAEEELVSFLNPSDLASLCTKAVVIGVISPDVRKRFDSLDPNVPRPSKVRYLLIHAYEQLEAKPWLLEKWLEVLCSHGVPSAVLRKAGGVGTADVGGSEGDKCSQDVARFSEEHVAALVDILASCSGKWRHICTSLNLPRNIEKNLEARLHMYDDVLCLREVLHEWIVGNHKHAKAPTLENLKKALESRMVGLGTVASQLDKGTLATHGICFTLPVLGKRNADSLCDNIMTPSSEKARLDLICVVSQPLDTKVADEKSTLLEVKISTCGATISYQWVKDDCPLKDNGEHYLGSNRSILCITGNLATEGTYTCEVRSSSSESEQQIVISNPAVVSINLPLYKQVLVDKYRAQSEVHRDAWPPVGNRTYINLALIKQRKLDKGDSFSFSTIQGDVDDVFCKKQRIGYDKAFGRHRNRALLLIEGRPGSGKTTLVHKVSRDWATGKPILKGAKLVFLISLRVLSASVVIKLADIVKKFFYKNDDETAQSVWEKINSTNGEGVCFILDGLDEYNKKDSIVFDLIRKEYLPRSMVIVSSRPSATFALRYKANVYIEVIGFLKAQIQEYIQHYPFSSKGSPECLLPYLDQHPNILRMCYLPVHVAMVSFLHDIVNGDLPSTECKMYEHFTYLTLRRKDSSPPPNSEVILMRICKRAFQMTLSHRQFYIDTEALSSSDTTDDNDLSLGLVTVDCTARLYNYHQLFTFVHLTFQEYLAAYYMAKLGEQEQSEIIRRYHHLRHMRVVWRFYCGLVSFKDEDARFTKILKLLHNDLLFHCQCAFESQQPATCKSVVLHNRNSLEFKATHPADFTCLGYVISNSSSPLDSLKVTDISTNDQTAKLYACADVLKKCGQLRVLDVKSNQVGDMGAKVLSAGLKLCSNLSILNLDHNEIGDKGAKDLGDGLRRCSNLSTLWLNNNKIGDEGAKGLGDGLMQCTNLSKLYLSENLIGDEGARGLGSGLRQCSNLSILQLNVNKIGDEGAEGLGCCLGQCNNLSELWLNNNNIGNEGAKALGNSLWQCSNLSKIWLNINRIGDDGAVGLVDGLSRCGNLSALYLKCNRISVNCTKYIRDCLRQYRNVFI